MTEDCATNFMQLNCILHKYMFSDVIPHGTMSKLDFYMFLTYHMLLGCVKVFQRSACHAKGLSVMHYDCNHDSHMNTMTS